MNGRVSKLLHAVAGRRSALWMREHGRPGTYNKSPNFERELRRQWNQTPKARRHRLARKLNAEAEAPV